MAESFLDHPKTWGFVSLIALAATFSPRVSTVPTWLCILLAFGISTAYLWRSSSIRHSAHPKLYPAAGTATLLAALLMFGFWLTGNKQLAPPPPQKEVLTSSPEKRIIPDIAAVSEDPRSSARALLISNPSNETILDVRVWVGEHVQRRSSTSSRPKLVHIGVLAAGTSFTFFGIHLAGNVDEYRIDSATTNGVYFYRLYFRRGLDGRWRQKITTFDRYEVAISTHGDTDFETSPLAQLATPHRSQPSKIGDAPPPSTMASPGSRSAPRLSVRDQQGRDLKDEKKTRPPLLTESAAKGTWPALRLRFVHPKNPALVVLNYSTEATRDIRWSAAVWNVDLPDRKDPLPIPVTTHDWIQARNEGEPQDLFTLPSVAALLKPGDRLFGSVAVDCAGCASSLDSGRVHGTTYIVSIVWGSGGWYSETFGTGRVMTFPDLFSPERREGLLKLEESQYPEIVRKRIY